MCIKYLYVQTSDLIEETISGGEKISWLTSKIIFPSLENDAFFCLTIVRPHLLQLSLSKELDHDVDSHIPRGQ